MPLEDVVVILRTDCAQSTGQIGVGSMWAAVLVPSSARFSPPRNPAEVIGIDPSERFIAHAREQVTNPRARFLVADARQLPESAPAHLIDPARESPRPCQSTSAIRAAARAAPSLSTGR